MLKDAPLGYPTWNLCLTIDLLQLRTEIIIKYSNITMNQVRVITLIMAFLTISKYPPFDKVHSGTFHKNYKQPKTPYLKVASGHGYHYCLQITGSWLEYDRSLVYN